MAEPSRTTWPDYAVRPVICPTCQLRITLKHAWTCWWDERTQQGFIWHRDCQPGRKPAGAAT